MAIPWILYSLIVLNFAWHLGGTGVILSWEYLILTLGASWTANYFLTQTSRNRCWLELVQCTVDWQRAWFQQFINSHFLNWYFFHLIIFLQGIKCRFLFHKGKYTIVHCCRLSIWIWNVGRLFDFESKPHNPPSPEYNE